MSEQETLLGDIRVLDLADQKGVYCTKLLADLGADTIKIEKPGGDPMRHIGPFFHDEPDPEKSLYWFQFNTSKRGITLNLETADGREILKKLVRTADVMVETFPPGYLDEMGLGYSVLKEINPGLVLTSITPFGQTGPYRDFKASDLIAQAMGGLMYLAGLLEDPPHKLHGSQAYHSASVQAAVGTVMALYARELTGRGQQVDVSMQESVLMSQETAIPSYDLRKVVRRRVSAETRVIPGVGLYPCKDGYIWSWVLAGAGVGWDVVNDWLDSEGRRIMMVPVQSPKDLLESPQLEALGYFVDVEHPELGMSLKYPGAPCYHISDAPWRISKQPPLIGEHNFEIYEGELGFSREQLATLKQEGAI